MAKEAASGRAGSCVQATPPVEVNFQPTSESLESEQGLLSSVAGASGSELQKERDDTQFVLF